MTPLVQFILLAAIAGLVIVAVGVVVVLRVLLPAVRRLASRDASGPDPN